MTSTSRRPQGAAAAAIFLQSSSRETSPCTTTTSAPALRQRSGRFSFRLAVGIVDDDARAALRQNGSGGGPEARGRTGDYRAQTILRHPHFLLLLLAGFRAARRSRAYHIVPRSARKSTNVPLCGIYSSPDHLMPPPHAALRTALVTAMAFAHHKAQEKTASEASASRARPVPINFGERCGGE